MNWYYVSNKKRLLLIGIVSFSFVSSSCAMMQRFKNIFVRKKEEPKVEESFLKKVESAVVSQLEKNPGAIEIIKKSFTQSQLVCISTLFGCGIGYAFKPSSSLNAAIGLTSLLAGGQILGFYDCSTMPLIKKIMDRIGTKVVVGAIVAISLPAGWLMCAHLPIATAVIGAILGHYVYKK